MCQVFSLFLIIILICISYCLIHSKAKYASEILHVFKSDDQKFLAQNTIFENAQTTRKFQQVQYINHFYLFNLVCMAKKKDSDSN